MTHEVVVNQKVIQFRLRYSSRRKTLGIEVHPGGRIEVIAPKDTALEVVEERVRLRARWIWKQLSYFRRYASVTTPRQFLRGETHRYLGRQYRLRLTKDTRPKVTMTRGWLEVASPDLKDRERISALVGHWYRIHAKACFQEVLIALQPPLLRKGYPSPKIIVRVMASRWGSLSPKGTMTLNLRLIQAPKACIEYVILHELCHLIHKTHSLQFFALLRRYMPDWEKRKQRLEKALL